MAEKYDVIVLGGGPAGLTAAIYAARARLRPLVVDTGTIGGQTVLTYAVANYPGVEETSGRDLSQTMMRQAKSFGARVIPYAVVTRLDLAGDPKVVELEDEGTFEAPTVILAPGGRPRTLGLETEERFEGQGISHCATCDGDFFTDKEIVVVGGGNSALEEAVSLTKYASKVTVLHILADFQAQQWAVDAAEANPKVELHTGYEVVRFEGGDSLRKVVARKVATGETLEVPAEGCFIFIGYVPNTEELEGLVELNGRGEVVADESMATSVPGVFVAGDARAKRYRQITTAVADGTIAALSAVDYVETRRRAKSAISATTSPAHRAPALRADPASSPRPGAKVGSRSTGIEPDTHA